MPPVCVAAFLRAFAIEPRQVGPRRRLDARGLREPRQKLLIRFARVAPHDAPQRRIRFERRRIDADRLSLDEVRRGQHLQDPRKHGTVGLQIDQAPRPRDRRVLGRDLVEPQAQESAERERIGGSPGDAALRVDAFEIPDQQQPEVRPRRQTRPAHGGGVERRALRFHELVEGVCLEHLIQPLVERVPTGRRQIIRRNPQPRRPCAVFATTHGHAGV